MIGNDKTMGERPACILGLGFRSVATVDDLLAVARTALDKAGLSATDLTAVASIDGKANSSSLQQLVAGLGVPLVLFDAAVLAAQASRLQSPSTAVVAAIGVPSVAEAAALAAAGPSARLLVSKIISPVATAAIARS